MKNASKIMYTIGKIINIIEIVCIALAAVCAIFGIACADDIFKQMTDKDLSKFQSAADVRSASIALLVGSLVLLIVSIVILVFANKAKKSIDSDSKNETPHIIMIVIGVFGDIFYLLGGVFGLVAQSQERSQTKHKE